MARQDPFPAPEPDTKDWTWVLAEPCPECGFDPDFPVADVAARLLTTVPFWQAALAEPGAARRPQPLVWSPLEYACHARDVCRIFAERLHLMRAEEEPVFADWDQDAVALADRYAEQDPRTVGEEYAAAATALAAAYSSLRPEELPRRGRRSSGAVFTVESVGRYVVHDIEHHVHDVRHAAAGIVRSVNVGKAAPVPNRRGKSGIDKRPVPSIEVRDPGSRADGLGSGVVGDDIVARAHHGGADQAVYAVSRAELDHWGAVLGRDLPDGMFGENLTVAGFDVDASLVGERWQVGHEAVLEVTGPRIPCATFGAHMQEPGWVAAYAARGRSGAYLAVIRPGTITPGDPVRVVRRPGHGIDVPTVFRAFTGDLGAARRVLASGALPPSLRAELAAKVAAREE